MSSDDLPLPIAILFLTVLAVIGLVMCPLVISDFNETKSYDKHTCSGVTDLDVQAGGIYAHGTLITNVLGSDGNVTGTAELFDPPIKHWLLIGDDSDEIEKWGAALGAADTFTCRLNAHKTEGVSALYDKMPGWYVFLVFSVLAAVVEIGLLLYVCFDTCSTV
jgi:hypothetical protein